MPHPGRDPTLGIVTPTFRRGTLLRRFLKRLVRQTYSHWRAVIVHDGPDAEIATIVGEFARREARITFMNTDAAANDVGVSPRHAGASHFARLDEPPDYCVFWDDDNYFATDALQKIAAALVAADRPDLLLVGMEYRSRVLPPAGIEAGAPSPGQIDTARPGIRSPPAVAAYAGGLGKKKRSPRGKLYTQEYMGFDYLWPRHSRARTSSAR